MTMSTEHDSNIDMADILIIDDESANLKLLSEMLVKDGYRVRPANSPRLAIDSALVKPPDLILLDVRMPDMDGFQVCDLLKLDERTRDIPILFISALQNPKDKVRCFELGGVDFISKPFQWAEVLARIRTHLMLRNMQRNLAELVAKRTAELDESEQLARTLLNATTDVSLLLDEDGTILDLNDAMAAELSGTREELVGTYVYDLLPQKAAEDRRKIIQQALLERKPIRYTDRHQPDKVFDAGIFPIETSAGEKGRAVIFAHDITELKLAEEELKKSEKMLQVAQEIAHLGNWKLDHLTGTLTCSDEVFRIFEIDREHFGGSYEAFLDAVHPEDRDMVDNAFKSSLKTLTSFDVKHRILFQDGRVKYAHQRCETDFSPEGSPLFSVGTVQDITEDEIAEKERLDLQTELAHLSRIMALNELSSSLAHEINQPLGAITNNANAARILYSRQPQESAEILEILEDISADARRAGQIIRKVRRFLIKEESRYELLDMNVLVGEVVELFQNSFGLEKVIVRLERQPDLPPVRGDRIQLQQVLMNLMINSLHAIRNSKQKEMTIRSALNSSGGITVSVSDTGPGIDDEIKDKLFIPFFTTKKEGIGMGLRISHSIIEEHGGRIWAENNPIAGATFYVSLNAYRGESE